MLQIVFSLHMRKLSLSKDIAPFNFTAIGIFLLIDFATYCFADE